MAFESQRDAAVYAALEAAETIRRFAGRLDPGAIEEKGRHDLVTAIDRESEAIIFDRLTGLFPGYGFMAEEGTATGPAELRPDEYRWIVDPIDGTTNFAHNLPPFCVSIALQKGDAIVVGVVYEVAHSDLFTATRGGGAFRNGARIRVSSTPALNDALLTTGFPFKESGHIDAYLAVLRRLMLDARAVRRPGSAAADLASVACGRMDGFFEIGLAAWDVAAGVLLIEEAGGRVGDLYGGDSVLFGHQIVASNGAIHDAMLERLEPLRRSVSLLR